MGIALPTELAGVAAKVGVQWPQADETAMHTAAQAWREAAAKISTLARDADTTAGQALDAMTGQAADAAKTYWGRFVHAENGHFTAAVKGCLEAADRLEQAADKIASAKVRITAKLSSLARSTDLSGVLGGTAKASDDHLLSGAALDINGILGDLTESVNLKGQSVQVDPAHPATTDGPLDVHGPKGGLLGLAAGLPGVDDLLTPQDGEHKATDPVWDPELKQYVDPVTKQPLSPTTAAQGTDPAGASPVPGLPGAVPGGVVPEVTKTVGLPDPAAVVHPAVDNSAEVTGPVPRHVVNAASGGAPSHVDPPTGPIPVQHGGGYAKPDYGDPNPPTGPIHLPVQGTSVQAAAAPVLPPPVASAPAVGGYQPPPAQPVAPTYWSADHTSAPGGYGPGALGGAAPGAVPPGGAVSGGSVPGGAAPGGAAPGAAAGSGVLGGAAPGGGAASGGGAAPRVQPGVAGVVAGVGSAPGVQAGAVAPSAEARRGPLADGALTGVAPDQVAKPVPAPRPVKPVLRPEDSPALFLAYLFPIGHMPVPSSRPARQLPLPEQHVDFAPGLRFPPHDHPDSGLITDERAPGPVVLPEPKSAQDAEVQALAVDHDPLGGEHERDWERRFLVREGGESQDTEYSWPPGELFPEGGCDAGEAVILEPGTVIDRFGDAEGRVFAPEGTPFAQRSLPPGHLDAGYQRYRVTGRLPVWRTLSAPWFGQPGGGRRYRAVYPAADLIAMGYLEAVS
ncbi:hypothetical protein GCM10010174_10870 [Kutzneria viridogrisea]|uniref:DUF4237 domain-containing protein n=1 Tax=Kutzneria viridogrisea TaxID=47990 RepID=A0ABR6BI50_9PSEU|nr:hypothetical protein [Kutzneria viridogrisea]